MTKESMNEEILRLIQLKASLNKEGKILEAKKVNNEIMKMIKNATKINENI